MPQIKAVIRVFKKSLIAIKEFFGVGKTLHEHQLFTLSIVFLIGLGWLGLILSMLSIFYVSILIIYLFLIAIILAYIAFINKKITKINWHDIIVFLVALLAIIIFSCYTVPTIFSGRDQGSLSETAIRLAQNHQFQFSFEAEKEFFNIYGPGKALNFPGFNYTENGNLITNFPLGYSTWLAIFYSIFGLNGLIVANGITFFIFILSSYLLAKEFFKPISSMILILFVFSCFIFFWFFKFTLSENLALMLFWFSVYEFILFLKTKKRLFLFASIFSMGLLLFSRIEALAFFAVMLIILFLQYRNWKDLVKAIGKKTMFVACGISILYLVNLVFNKAFYLVLLKAILKPFMENNSIGEIGINEFSFFYVGKILFIYGLANFIFLGTVGLIFLFWKKKKSLIFVPFFVALPAFIYLFVPSISSDHPWMLRRFLFAVIPVFIFYTGVLLDYFSKKKIYFYILAFVVLVGNFFVAAPYLKITLNKNLLPQIKELSEKFDNSDLILVDRNATGDYWSMMTGPMNFLYGKQAVYFFNPDDINKIDLTKFKNVYFIISDENLDFYRESGLSGRLETRERYQIKNIVLSIADELPLAKEIIVSGKIYLLKQ